MRRARTVAVAAALAAVIAVFAVPAVANSADDPPPGSEVTSVTIPVDHGYIEISGYTEGVTP